jgi:hypothetical protein
MRVKTSELTGAALDWAVAKCEGAFDWRQRIEWHNKPWQCSFRDEEEPDAVYHCYLNELEYSTDWAQGGPIIEREGITIGPTTEGTAYANMGLSKHHRFGTTPLIAAMRCYVASKLGDQVDIPEKLCP